MVDLSLNTSKQTNMQIILCILYIKSSPFIGLVGWFYGISTLGGLFNAKNLFFQAMKWFQASYDNYPLWIFIASRNYFLYK